MESNPVSVRDRPKSSTPLSPPRSARRRQTAAAGPARSGSPAAGSRAVGWHPARAAAGCAPLKIACCYNTLSRQETPTGREGTMDNSTSWVVYVMTMHNAEGRRAVCEQSEWEQMERDRPGYHTLVQSGITSEAEAEKLARGTAGDSRLSATSKRRC